MSNICKKIKKYTTLLLVVLMMFLISGCVLFDVSMGIDSNNTAYLIYHIELDIAEFNAHQQHNFKQALYQIAIHYHENLGFSVNLETDSNPLILTAEKRVLNNSFEQAFDSLKSMMTDEQMTIFMQVDMSEISYPRQSGYFINATLDIPRIIKSNELEELPPGFMRSYEDAIRDSSGTLTISMPADEIFNASHDAEIINTQVEMTVPLNFDSQTVFRLSAKQYLHGNVSGSAIGAIIEQLFRQLFGDSDDSFIRQQFYFRSIAEMISFIGVVLIIITVAISIIVIIVKRRKKSL